MEEVRSFAPLLIVIFLAFAIPLLLTRFRRFMVPVVVGEIVAGILVGRSGLQWVQHHDLVLDLLSEVGFVFLMFLAGLEIDFSNLGRLVPSSQNSRNRRIWSPLPLAALNFVLTLGLSLILALGLAAFGLTQNVVLMALILSTTSLGVVLPVLKERGMSTGRFGQSVLLAALIADFVTMLLITVDVAVLSRGLTFDILLIGALFVVFFLVYRFGNFFFNQLPVIRRAMEELSHATVQIKVRAAFTMMFIFVVLSEVLGTELILGAFLAGAMVALLRTPADNELVHQLESIGYGFFIPIFFIMVGVDFNLAALYETPQALLLVPVLLVVAIGVKFIPALLYRLNFSWRETFAAGILLSARLSLIIAAAEIGLDLGIITEAVDMAIILVAMITVTAAPTIYVRLMPEGPADQACSVLVVGAEDFGLQVAEQLRAHHEQVIVMDEDAARLARARRHGFEAVFARLDCDDPAAAPYLERTQILVCTFADVDLCFRVCSCAISSYGLERVVSLVTQPSAQEKFQQLGVITLTVSRDRAALLALLARNPDIYQLLTRTDDAREVAEVIVRNHRHDGVILRDLSLPGDVVVLTLHRDGEFFVPHGATRLNEGDRLTLVGSFEDIDLARQLLDYFPMN